MDGVASATNCQQKKMSLITFMKMCKRNMRLITQTPPPHNIFLAKKIVLVVVNIILESHRFTIKQTLICDHFIS